MKRIHIFQHVPFETSGCIEAWIREKSYIMTETRFFEGDSVPDISDIDWLIVMGGGMSVHDTVEFPWLINEKSFIKEAVNKGKSVIGICLGSQLIAEVLGSRVYRNREKEIGWFPVKRINTGDTSPLLKEFNETEIVFHWHGDTFDIPEGSIHMFSSSACMNQCFVYRGKVLGLQFHLEVTEELLNNMIDSGEDELVSAPFIQSVSELREGASSIIRNNEIMYSILNEFDKFILKPSL